MIKGKKEKAFKIFLKTLSFIKKKTKLSPFYVVKKALRNVKPLLGLKNVKKGRKKYEVPYVISYNMSQRLGIKWIIEHAKLRTKKGFNTDLAESLCDELIDASNLKGLSIKKRKHVHWLATENEISLRFWFL